MQIISTRDVDPQRTISELESKINVKPEKGKPLYQINVNRQLLIDAVDLLKHYTQSN